MTLRSRLALGIMAIALALLVPLGLSLRALDKIRAATETLRDREFAATLLIGRMREEAAQLDRAKDILALFPNDTTRRAFSERLATLGSQADTLDGMRIADVTRRLHDAIAIVDSQAPRIYELAAAGRGATADTLIDLHTEPAINDIQNVLAAAEATLKSALRGSVDRFADESNRAQRASALALAVAAILAALIGIWLTRSISKPVEDLERGMQAVSEGHFAHALRVSSKRGDEFGRLAASYRSMASQLAQLDRLKAEFISVASHELKTPINVIMGYLQLLQEGVYGPLTARQLEIFQTLGSQADSVSRLAMQLLDVGRFEAGGGKLELREVNLGVLLGELETAFRVLALQRGVAFDVRRGPSLPAEVVWDEDRMNEVLGNLLSNAFKFTERGGHVSLNVESDGERVRMQVRDSGAGIPAQQLSYVFEKFYQADNQGLVAMKGAGLGLAIAKGIVGMHGGEIMVESKVGEGTTFTILLPIRVVARRAAVSRPLAAALL